MAKKTFTKLHVHEFSETITSEENKFYYDNYEVASRGK